MSTDHRATLHKRALIDALVSHGPDYTVSLAEDQLAAISAMLADILGPYDAADVLHRAAWAIVKVQNPRG